MDASLVAILYDQMNIGNKVDVDWKSQAYQAAVDELNGSLGLKLTKDNIKNRIQIWKKHYAVVTDIMNQSGGLSFDDERKMVMVTGETQEVWLSYLKSHSDAKGYNNKVIVNWDDIVMLCGKDRATGLGAQNIEDAADIVVGEDENDVELIEEPTNGSRSYHTRATSSASAHSPSHSHHKKRSKKDPLAEAIARMATSVEEYIASKKKETGSVEEIYDLVSKVEGLTELEVLEVVQRLMHGSMGKFSLLKSLPDNKKNAWVKVLLSHPLT